MKSSIKACWAPDQILDSSRAVTSGRSGIGASVDHSHKRPSACATALLLAPDSRVDRQPPRCRSNRSESLQSLRDHEGSNLRPGHGRHRDCGSPTQLAKVAVNVTLDYAVQHRDRGSQGPASVNLSGPAR
jgi:hypothetical protein